MFPKMFPNLIRKKSNRQVAHVDNGILDYYCELGRVWYSSGKVNKRQFINRGRNRGETDRNRCNSNSHPISYHEILILFCLLPTFGCNQQGDCRKEENIPWEAFWTLQSGCIICFTEPQRRQTEWINRKSPFPNPVLSPPPLLVVSSKLGHKPVSEWWQHTGENLGFMLHCDRVPPWVTQSEE